MCRQLLAWKGIEVTHEIAMSANAKVVLIGNSRDSLPVIFGDQASPFRMMSGMMSGSRMRSSSRRRSGGWGPPPLMCGVWR